MLPQGCKKRIFSTKATAKRTLRNTSLNKSCRAYLCPKCGYWHTASKKKLKRYNQQLKRHAEWISNYKTEETDK